MDKFFAVFDWFLCRMDKVSDKKKTDRHGEEACLPGGAKNKKAGKA
jgi:hypothetical protein